MKPLVLIVEDDPEAAALMESILVREGCEVLIAHDGERGLDLARELPSPDLILLDLEMPILDGRELLRTMHADSTISSIPVVVVSSADDATTLYATDNVRKCQLLDGLRRVLARLPKPPETVRESA